MPKSLYYTREGAGFPVVFLHGFLEDLSMWKSMCCINGIEAICIDLPGHGKSIQSKDTSMHAVAAQIIELLMDLEIDRYHLVGHSMGGYIGLEILKNDQRVKGLVLMNSNFWSDDHEKRINRERVARAVLKNKSLFLYESIPNLFFRPFDFDSEVKELINTAKKISAATIANYSISMSTREQFDELVHARQEDILILQGANDLIVELSKMKKATEDFKQLKMIVLNGGHMSHIEDMQQCAALIEQFLFSNFQD